MNRLLAAIYDRAMAPVERRLLSRRRRWLLYDVEGDVLEIGAGTGANLPHYRHGVRLVATEPGAPMRRKFRERAAGVEILAIPAERLPFPDASFDAVVCTLVLCSVEVPVEAISEVARVLRPGGTLRFIEHVRGTGFVAWMQRLLTPFWRRLAANCHLDRATLDELARQGLRVEVTHRDSLGLLFPLVTGRAVKE
jgi:SAM-dependent methyltransferase